LWRFGQKLKKFGLGIWGGIKKVAGAILPGLKSTASGALSMIPGAGSYLQKGFDALT